MNRYVSERDVIIIIKTVLKISYSTRLGRLTKVIDANDAWYFFIGFNVYKVITTYYLFVGYNLTKKITTIPYPVVKLLLYLMIYYYSK